MLINDQLTRRQNILQVFVYRPVCLFIHRHCMTMRTSRCLLFIKIINRLLIRHDHHSVHRWLKDVRPIFNALDDLVERKTIIDESLDACQFKAMNIHASIVSIDTISLSCPNAKRDIYGTALIEISLRLQGFSSDRTLYETKIQLYFATVGKFISVLPWG